ncbi:uncharacterized protein LOC124913146 [Impatiens glandulifera]|uniref:uncharacterized protein LOC124913146 n=1 Tax=Impatiens glandulifera TaxID=253017 RepID=UPI001FB16AF3|nr:uncharacterized protein LOC124913146 [Impatiens glandulifera]
MDIPSDPFNLKEIKQQWELEESLLKREKELLEELQRRNNRSHEYLRRPNGEDLQRLLQVGQERDFPGMIGSLARTVINGHKGTSTIIFEAVASYDLWIWHAFFGMPGTLNDINVLDRSPIFDDIESSEALAVNFTVNGRQYNLAYYLANEIYPKWPIFVQSIQMPQGDKAQLFAKQQEACRKM